MLGIPESAVKSHLSRARSQIRRHLDKNQRRRRGIDPRKECPSPGVRSFCRILAERVFHYDVHRHVQVRDPRRPSYADLRVVNAAEARWRPRNP
jgi:hypothetical protein